MSFAILTTIVKPSASLAPAVLRYVIFDRQTLNAQIRIRASQEIGEVELAQVANIASGVEEIIFATDAVILTSAVGAMREVLAIIASLVGGVEEERREASCAGIVGVAGETVGQT